MMVFLELVLIPAIVPLFINVLINQIEHWTDSGDAVLDKATCVEAAEAGSRNIQQEPAVRT